MSAMVLDSPFTQLDEVVEETFPATRDAADVRQRRRALTSTALGAAPVVRQPSTGEARTPRRIRARW